MRARSLWISLVAAWAAPSLFAGTLGADVPPAPPSAPARATDRACAEVCDVARRALGECTLAAEVGIGLVAAAGVQARLSALDCERDCERWPVAEVARVDACFPRERCDDYRRCLAEPSRGVPAPEPVASRRRAKDGAEEVRVAAGPFVAGVPALWRVRDELAMTTVDVPAFWIDRAEVTLDRYMACFREGACEAADPPVRASRARPSEHGGEADDDRLGCNWGSSGRGAHPVNCVDYAAAKRYCAWAGARLPSEAEWEKAARGPYGRRFPWGMWDRVGARLRWAGSEGADGGGRGSGVTSPVGAHPAGDSYFGVHDLAGNVAEWVAGRFAADRFATPGDDFLDRGAGEAWGVVRGGGWGAASLDDLEHDATTRVRWFKARRSQSVGFRCAEGEGP